MREGDGLKIIIFNLVKEKIKNEYLVRTSNMMSFLALKLIKTDRSLFVKIGDMVVSSNNSAHFVSQALGAAKVGFIGCIFSVIQYSIVILIVYYSMTENCGYKCNDYFTHITVDLPIIIYANNDIVQLAI